MPSPFPGMNPYLEHSDFWAEVHHWLITLIAEALVPQVRPQYRVAIEKRIYEINQPYGDNPPLIGIPDVMVKRQSTDTDQKTSNVAVAPPVTQPVIVTVPMPDQIQQAYLEVREIATGQVITVIEILSPVNKRSGEGRENYQKKRQRILGSLTHLVEIDLLRGWQPMPILNHDFQTDYRILVSCSDLRPQANLYEFNLPDPIPAFSLPLRSQDQKPVLDLQELLHRLYDRAGYDFAIDYNQEIVPPLSDQNVSWVNTLLQDRELI